MFLVHRSIILYIKILSICHECLFVLSRLPGRAALIKQLCCAYDRGMRPVIDSADMDVHTASSLLKLFLRELPDPLIPTSYYETVMNIVTRQMPVGEAEVFLTISN